MSNLTEFLLARIAEDERRNVHAIECPYGLSGGVDDCECWEGARNRRDVEAKRRIVAKAERADIAFSHQINPATSTATFALTEVLQWLALPYADHPDYREEWAL